MTKNTKVQASNTMTYPAMMCWTVCKLRCRGNAAIKQTPNRIQGM